MYRPTRMNDRMMAALLGRPVSYDQSEKRRENRRQERLFVLRAKRGNV